MPTWYMVVRWLHVISATAWFGEVVTINFVLVPAVSQLKDSAQAKFLAGIFPKIFKLASWLSGTAVITGGTLGYYRFRGDFSVLWTTTSGLCFLVGASLACVLAFFHFVLEPRLDGMICTAAENEDFEMTAQIARLLRIIPRAGGLVLLAAFVLMMIGAHGTGVNP